MGFAMTEEEFRALLKIGGLTLDVYQFRGGWIADVVVPEEGREMDLMGCVLWGERRHTRDTAISSTILDYLKDIANGNATQSKLRVFYKNVLQIHNGA